MLREPGDRVEHVGAIGLDLVGVAVGVERGCVVAELDVVRRRELAKHRLPRLGSSPLGNARRGARAGRRARRARPTSGTGRRAWCTRRDRRARSRARARGSRRRGMRGQTFAPGDRRRILRAARRSPASSCGSTSAVIASSGSSLHRPVARAAATADRDRRRSGARRTPRAARPARDRCRRAPRAFRRARAAPRSARHPPPTLRRARGGGRGPGSPRCRARRARSAGSRARSRGAAGAGRGRGTRRGWRGRRCRSCPGRRRARARSRRWCSRRPMRAGGSFGPAAVVGLGGSLSRRTSPRGRRRCVRARWLPLDSSSPTSSELRICGSATAVSPLASTSVAPSAGLRPGARSPVSVTALPEARSSGRGRSVSVISPPAAACGPRARARASPRRSAQRAAARTGRDGRVARARSGCRRGRRSAAPA